MTKWNRLYEEELNATAKTQDDVHLDIRGREF